MFYCGVRLYAEQNYSRNRTTTKNKKENGETWTEIIKGGKFIDVCASMVREPKKKKISILNGAFNRNINNAFGDKSIPLRKDSMRCFFSSSFYLCQLLSKSWENFKKMQFRCFEVENSHSIDRLPYSTLLHYRRNMKRKIQKECIVCKFSFILHACVYIFLQVQKPAVGQSRALYI